MPNAVCSLLRDSGVRDLGVHTEMLTDGIVDLYRAGVVTGARTTLDPGKVVCTFGVGTAIQYQTADHNPDIRCHAVDLTNPPHIVMRNDRVVAINSMTSTYERHGARASRVVVDLTPGNVITTTRADMMYVVTEYGIVNLKGKSIPERARAMISVAHPDFREDLERDACGHGLIPKGTF